MNNFPAEKDEIRSSLPLPDLTPAEFGKLAEQVRRSKFYYESKQIFVDPGPLLLQVRINAILDQKELILPSAGLKEGFIRFKPNTIPANKLSYALSFKGMGEFGEKLPSDMLGSLEIDLAVIASEAVDGLGGRLGDGLGFTDICLALFKEYDSLKNSCKVVTVIPDSRVLTDSLPLEPWDIGLDGYITQSDAQYVSVSKESSRIIWSELPKKRIRRIQPLWDLFCKLNPLPAETKVQDAS